MTFGIEKKLPSWSASPPGKILLMKIPLTSLPSRLHPPQILMPVKKKEKEKLSKHNLQVCIACKRTPVLIFEECLKTRIHN